MKTVQKSRKHRGSAITEFGPALFLFFIVIFFPMLDLLDLAAVYCCGWYANFVCVRELAVRPQAQAGNVVNEINAEFTTNAGAAKGIGDFIGVNSPGGSLVQVPGFPPAAVGVGGTNLPPIVTCATTITAPPFLTVPFVPANVPGLSGNIVFTITSERPREVTN